MRALDRVFDGRFRIRYSQARGAWHIEQKAGRLSEAFAPGYDDDSIRLRDGYVLVCEVRTGDRMPCPRCGRTLKVPVFEFAEVICLPCARSYGKVRATTVAGYFDLNERLIEYLRSIDPYRTPQKRMVAEMDLANARLEAIREKDAMRPGQDALYDYYNKLVGIPEFGYSGKTQMWADAPESPGPSIAKDAA